MIDGWAIGRPFDCPDFIGSGLSCAEEIASLIAVATAGFDRRNPGHAPIASVTLHEEGVVFDPAGSAILTVRSGGCCDVARFQLVDGTLHAIGVGYPGVSDEPFASDYGPNR